MIPMFLTSLENPLVILVILLIILVLFGAKRIPEVMHGLGKGLSEFKKGTREATDQLHQAMSTEPPPAEVPPAATPAATPAASAATGEIPPPPDSTSKPV